MSEEFKQDISLFVASFSQELEAKKNRVEHLISNSHHGTVGSYHDSLIRSQIRRILPSKYCVSTGFIARSVRDAKKDKNKLLSNQIDILIWDNINHSPIFEEDGFVVIAPEACVGAIEVTKSLSKSKIKKDLAKLDSVSKFTPFLGSGKRPVFTAIVGLNNSKSKPVDEEKIISAAIEYYKENKTTKLRDEESSFENTRVSQRHQYVDVVTCLENCSFVTHESRNIHVAYSYKGEFAGNFEIFSNVMFDNIVAGGQLSVAHLVQPGLRSFRTDRESLKFESWTAFENEDIPEVLREEMSDYIDKYQTS